jgi:hypothetical protein
VWGSLRGTRPRRDRSRSHRRSAGRARARRGTRSARRPLRLHTLSPATNASTPPGALCHYLKQLGAEEVAAVCYTPARVGVADLIEGDSYAAPTIWFRGWSSLSLLHGCGSYLGRVRKLPEFR